MTAEVIRVEGVTKVYQMGHNEVHALRGIDLKVESGEMVAVMGASGLLDTAEPNLTRFLFTDPRAKTFFTDWDELADAQVIDLWMAPAAENAEWFSSELAPAAGAEFTRRLNRHTVPDRTTLRLAHPAEGALRLHRETLELPTDFQQLIVLLPADEETAAAVRRLRDASGGRRLKAIS